MPGLTLAWALVAAPPELALMPAIEGPAAPIPAQADDDAAAAPAPVGPGVDFVPGKGVRFASGDGRFALALGLRTGVIAQVQRDGDGDLRHSRDVRRLRVLFAGHAFGAHNNYYVQLALSPRDLDLHDGSIHASPLLDAYLRFDQRRDAIVTVGQYRVPFSRERNVSDVNPLLIDRSLVNGEFNLDRALAVGVHADDLGGAGHLRYYAGLFLGPARDDAGGFDRGGLMPVVRVDVLPFGLFDDYESSDQARIRRFHASLGAAYAYQERSGLDRGTRGDPFVDGGAATMHNFTADAALRWAGWSLDAAYHLRLGRRVLDPGAARASIQAPRNGQGWMVQSAYLLPRTRLELAGRYSAARAIGPSSLRPREELGAGLNYYFAGHDLKLQFDYFRTYAGHDLRGGDDLFRVQLQVNL